MRGHIQRVFCPVFLSLVLGCPGVAIAQSNYSHPYYWQTLAGVSKFGFRNGSALSSQFALPGAVCESSTGIVYVADSTNCVIRKVSGGVVTTLAGMPGVPGFADGTGSGAQFAYPSGLAIDASGNLYVADTDNEVIRKVTPAGVVTTIVGTPGVLGSSDGTGPSASFWNPAGIAIDSGGNLYVTDSDNITVRKITPGGDVSTIAGTLRVSGSQDGTGSGAQFAYPYGIAVDGAGNVYVADIQNNNIRKITPGGVVSTFAGLAGTSGSTNATGTAARFHSPNAVASDAAGNLYVADTGNDTIRMITPGGVVSTLAGTAGAEGSSDGTGAAARFSAPAGVSVDSSGNVLVADTYNSTVRVIAPGWGVTTVAGIAALAGSADGPPLVARFSGPWGVARDGAGNAYIADSFNNTVRKVTASGTVSTIAGTAGVTGTLDGTGPAAQFNSPAGTAVDAGGVVYVADSANHTIRKIAADGTVTTFAGTAGVAGSHDGTGTGAQFKFPEGISLDRSGNLYVADSGNDTIRMITPGGVVTTVSGTAGITGTTDGPAAGALFSGPAGVAVDGSGNIYVVDSGNSSVRLISSAGQVSTLAGSPGSFGGSADGSGAGVGFYGPEGIAVDGSGNVYVADSFNNEIRRISSGGAVTTLGGVAEVDNEIDGIGETAQFNTPIGIASDAAGNLIVADSFNNVIRTGIPYNPVSIQGGPLTQTTNQGGTVVLTVAASGTGSLAYQWKFNGAILSDGSGVSGSNGATLTLTNVQPGESGAFSVTVTDGLGQTASASATLTVVSTVPVILAQPSSQSSQVGSPATFTVGASGGSALSYQWSVDGTVIAGATASSYTISSVLVSDSGSYSVTVTDEGGSVTSQAAFLTVSSSSGGPSVAAQPSSFTTVSGGTVVLTVDANGATTANVASVRLRTNASTFTYQWFFNGAVLADGGGVVGSRTATLLLTHGAARAGGYACLISNTAGSVLSQTSNLVVASTADPGRLVNLSTRAAVGSGANILIAGFVSGGAGASGTQTVLIRGIGPALGGFGLSGALADPQLTLLQGTTSMAANAGWSGSAQITAADASVGAFALADPSSGDSALLVSSLAPNAYTAQVSGKSGDSGIGLVEVYDASPSGSYTPTSARLVNISARARVGTGANVMIAGFVIGGSTSKTVLIRASGPALAAFGLAGTLPDPKLQLFQGTTAIASNTGWGGDPQIASVASAVGAFSWGSAATADSVILITLQPGSYTAQVSGAAGDSGLGLVEIYDVQ